LGSFPSLSASLFDCTRSERCGFFVRNRWDELARTRCEAQKTKAAEGRLKVQSKRLDAPQLGSAITALAGVANPSSPL